MRTYTVHELSGAPADGRGIIFIREGFSWPAAVFTLVWLLAKRLWIAAGFWFALTVAVSLSLAALGASEELVFVVNFVMQGFLAVLAHDVERWSLHRSGYREIGIAAGPDLLSAERDFFRHWTRPIAASVPVAPSPVTAPVWPRKSSREDEPLGLFPHAGA